jgi:hypothetical protein
MDSTLDQCRWPPLSDPYDRALRQAVAYILSRYEVLGLLVSGTIVRGNPHPASDLDIYVVHAQPSRQRLQKFFNGVPAEMFVNPVRQIEAYMREEQAEGRPITSHMWATGFLILDRHPSIAQLRQRARVYLAQNPQYSQEYLTNQRYMAATSFEDACDIAPQDPAGASLMLSGAIMNMLQYAYLKAGRFIPRVKDLLVELDRLDPRLAALAREYCATSQSEQRLALAGEIADLTIGVRGFFEWESPLEDLSAAPKTG